MTVATPTKPVSPPLISPSKLTTEQQRWQAYEAAKRQWREEHPNASAAEHEDAMQAIARRLGA